MPDTTLNVAPLRIDPTRRLDELAAGLLLAKAKRAVADRDIRRLEDEIIALVGNRDEGSETHHAARHTVTTTRKINRALDADKVKTDLFWNLPEAVYKRLFTWTPKLNLAELRYLENNEPEVYAQVADAITTKPAKTAVTVKPIDDGGAAA